MGILNYFGTIVRQKYKDTKIGVTIKQEGKKVTMVIETPEGVREEVEKTLEEYGMVVDGSMSIQDFLSNDNDRMEFKQKLELVYTELRFYKERYKELGERINNDKKQIQCLNNHISDSLKLSNKTIQFSQDVIKLIEKKADSETEVHVLNEKLKNTVKLSEQDVQEIKQLLTSIENKKPEIHQKIADVSSRVVVGATGSALWTIIQEALKHIPSL